MQVGLFLWVLGVFEEQTGGSGLYNTAVSKKTCLKNTLQKTSYRNVLT